MEYLVIGAVLAVFIVVVFVIAKKDSKERDEMVGALTDEQRSRLLAAEPVFVDKSSWTQEAMVAKITDKGSKFDVRMLWYNTTIGNNEQDTITLADATISKAEQDKHQLKKGDFVKLYIAPEKTVGSIKIVFDEA